MEGKEVMSKYRKVNDLMRKAALILIKHGWRADRFEELFSLRRSSAFRLAKQAREEYSRIVVEEALEKARRRQAEEAVRLGEGWQGKTKSPKPGLPLGNVRRFRA
jgi:hypothetical protein